MFKMDEKPKVRYTLHSLLYDASSLKNNLLNYVQVYGV